jgi:putative endonuclease
LDIAAPAAAAQARAMADGRQVLGRAAEEAAAAFLRRAGFAIVERNVRYRAGEIDLVCRDEGVVVFVEVKCRRPGWDATPAAAVSWHKQRRLTRLAQLYLKQHRLTSVRCRFDVVSVTLTERGTLDVRHVRAAFDAVAP